MPERTGNRGSSVELDPMPPLRILSTRLVAGLTAAALFGGAAPAARAQGVDPATTDLPVLSREVPRGEVETVAGPGAPVVGKTIDGDPSDWTGVPTRFGGTVAHSAGELVYQDHLFDAHGPDDGRDASRLETTDPITEIVPEAYRLDALAQADAPGQVGAPTPEQFSYNESYGDAAPHQDASDLHEVRLALDGTDLLLLARTTTMNSPTETGLLLLADTAENEGARDVPFNSGITSEVADSAVFLSGSGGRAVDLSSGAETSLPDGAIAVDPGGYTNAIEARIPLELLGSPDDLRLAVASGPAAEGELAFRHLDIEMSNETPHANLANVAFRLDEPVRTWWDRNQALSLFQGTIDPFFLPLDSGSLTSGSSETFHPGAGYHDRIFISSEHVARERGRDGIVQHYGLYLPEAYDGDTAAPLQWWLHWRGGDAHTAAAVAPRIFKHFGEDQDTIVVAPSGRGTGRWYVGKGHVDFLEVWADVFDTVAIDRDRVYATGHSMGGWGSYLLTLLYPDRFAAAAPYAGPVTQGAWTGLDFEGCDEFAFDGNTPCYIEANGSRPRDQHTRKLLENSLHVPYAIMHGTSDELVPYSGVARQAERLQQLGHRFRFYTYPGYEHYSHPIADQWSEAARYLHSFARPENPRRVTYKRDMPFELATEEVQSDGVPLDFDFDSAYWMSELEARDAGGTALFDGTSLALADQPYLVAPDTGPPTSPGTTGPYVIAGQQWLNDPLASAAEPENGFEVTLTGAAIARLDLARMNIDAGQASFGRVTSDGPSILRLDGDWAAAPTVTIDGQDAAAAFDEGVVSIPVPQGSSLVVVTPTEIGEEGPPVIAFTDASDRSGQYSDDATFEALLVDGSGAPIADGAVTFELSGGDGSHTASATTNDQGLASATTPLVDRPGSYTVTVSYPDDNGVAEQSIDFEILTEDTALELSSDGKGSNSTLTATLTDADSGAGIEGRTIDFYADGSQIGSATTDSTGTATIEVPPRYRSGRSDFTSTFSGDDFYRSSGT